ncbi:hypothetical protein KFE25_005232 [Diacronema lutheri]|uniref:Uncharacterized protein n=3 Tax=Diacronema lutheri TaxID=2081491 RepID=A0A8J5X962_DIALT|nr:hypothetical protein KFE25_005232 [Diacronema lutheri]
MRLAVVACVGEDGERAPLRAYIRTQRPMALDGLRQLRGPELHAAVDKLATEFARWRGAPDEGAARSGAAAQAGAGPVRIDESALRGISLSQLRAFIAQAASRCEAEGGVTAQTMTFYDLTKHAIEPLAQRTGLSVVETLASGPQPPVWCVSHWWGEPVADFVKCLEQHCADRWLEPSAAFYWVSAFALRHGAVREEMEGGMGASPFMRALQLTDGMISVLDRRAVAISRAWCALELFVANLERGSTYLHDIYTPFEHSRGGRPHAAVGLVDGFAAIDRANPLSKSAAKSEREAAFPADALARAESFELARAEASEPSDLAAIRAWVGDEAPLLDATVRARFGIVRLTQLVAAGVPDGNVRLRALLDALRCSRLRKLSCELAQPSAGAVARLCASLPASLAELRLVSAGPSVALPISTSLRSDSLQLLCVLNLPYCALGDEEGAELGAALGAAGCRLVELRLRSNNVGPGGAVALAKALERNATLTYLNLGENKVGVDGASALAKALERNRALTTLELWHNDVGDEGGVALASALEHNSALLHLDLGYNAVCDGAAVALAKALERNTALRTLWLRANQVSTEGGIALGKALEHNRALTTLDLKENKVGDCAVALCKALERTTSLVTLDFGTDAAGAAPQMALLLKNGTGKECVILT